MKSVKELCTLACILCLGQALIPGISAQSSAKAADSNPVVSISTGQLRGSLTADGAAVFKNIPFAQPPVGELRWREPLPARAWPGVRDATAFGPMCNQNDNKQLPHSEDCLQLNVWTRSGPGHHASPSWYGFTVEETPPDREWKLCSTVKSSPATAWSL
jgi:para-nitrobenzyl esterase